MKHQDIIEMANQAGLHFYEFVWTSPTKENLYPEGVHQEALEAFAKLVAEHEREACAKVCEEYETANDIADTWLNIVSEVIRARGQA